MKSIDSNTSESTLTILWSLIILLSKLTIIGFYALYSCTKILWFESIKTKKILVLHVIFLHGYSYYDKHLFTNRILFYDLLLCIYLFRYLSLDASL